VNGAPPDFLGVITSHSTGFADAARVSLDANVEHCPGWRVADLVAHLTDVHWFWATIVEERLDAPPDEGRRPPRVATDDLVDTFERGALRLVSVLKSADQAAGVWTWAPAQHDVAFVTRHQAQEAAVHHFDAAHAAGTPIQIEPAVASDAVDEFLTFSVSSDADPADPPRAALGGSFVLECSDLPAAWTVSDGSAPGTVAHAPGRRPGLPVLRASSSDLLLWLYGRVDLDTGSLPAGLAERFRGLTFTD
jgi:uncharacterized protein (TIGR03083 family)